MCNFLIICAYFWEKSGRREAIEVFLIVWFCCCCCARNYLRCFVPAEEAVNRLLRELLINFARGGGGGAAHVKILTGMLVLLFWVWNLAKSYFSGLANFLAIFLDFAKFPLFFWVWQISSYFFGSSNFCVTHLNPLHEEHTVLKNIKS